MDTVKLREQVMEGERARDILHDPVMKRVFEQIDKRIVDGFKESRGDLDVMQKAYYLSIARDELEQALKTIINSGDKARRTLKQQ